MIKIKRTLVIGDIHNGYLALVQVLERCNFNKKEDQLIFLGDYVDGFATAVETIDYLIKLKNECDFKPIFILGNHDAWLREYLVFGVVNFNWLNNGGHSTLNSYRKTTYDLNEHRKFIDQLDYYYIDNKNRLFVHGGFKAPKGVRDEFQLSTLYWDRSLLDAAYTVSHQHKDNIEDLIRYRPKRLNNYKEIFIGHTPTLMFATDQPLNFYNLWNLDTGGGSNGRLTIMDVDTKEYWQSDLLTDLYNNDEHLIYCKNEKGID
jgi:serine/threonine protein phosphatase 1